MLLDEVEQHLDPLGRSEVRVVLFLEVIGVSEAREYLDDAFHAQRIARAHCSAQAWFVRGSGGLPGGREALEVPRGARAPWRALLDRSDRRSRGLLEMCGCQRASLSWIWAAVELQSAALGSEQCEQG